MRVGGQFGNDSLLKIAKSRLSFPFEKLANRAAQTLLYDLVTVNEALAQAVSKAPADGRFTGTGQTDECNRHGR